MVVKMSSAKLAAMLSNLESNGYAILDQPSDRMCLGFDEGRFVVIASEQDPGVWKVEEIAYDQAINFRLRNQYRCGRKGRMS